MIRRLLYSSDDSSEEEQRVSRRKIYKERVNFQINDNFEFKEAFRLSKAQVQYVIDRIGDELTPRNNRNHPLSVEQQLLLTLHWLGNGAQMHGVAKMHGVKKSTVSRTIEKVINTIIVNMFENIVRWPANTQEIAVQFLQKGGFPCVCGCVDGTLINVDKPTIHEEVYVDRYGDHSLNIMMICGPNHYFYAVNANWPGSAHDSRVFRNTATYQRFDQGWRPFPGAVILGDSAYPTRAWLIPPLHRNPNNQDEIRYNNAHKRTRKLVEDSFGILKEKFPCLNHLRMKPRKAAKVVLACVTLHNVAKTVDREEDVQPKIFPENYEVDEYNDNDNGVIDQEIGPGAEERINQLLRYFRN